jgi:hypothetical protein
VQVLGSWNGWRQPGVVAAPLEPGFWQTAQAMFPTGRHAYKFLLDGRLWLDDPGNPSKVPDGVGGFNSVIVVQSGRRASGRRTRGWMAFLFHVEAL